MFKTVQESFNHYRKHTREQLETRAAEIREEVEENEEADVKKLNVEIEGIMNVLDDEGERSKARGKLNPILNNNEGINKAETRAENPANTQEYRNAFFKSLAGNKLNEKETRAFNNVQEAERRDALTSEDAGAVLPTETLNEVIRLAREKGGLINEVRSFNMPTGIKIPIGTPTEKASWHKEGEKVDPDDVELASVKFDGYEIVKVFSLSIKVKTMSIPAFESYLTEELANAVMMTISDSIVNGDGNEKGTGILNESLETVTAEGNYKDFTSAIGKLKRGYAGNAKFAMNHSTLYKHVYGTEDGNERPIFIQDAQSNEVGRIFGKKVILDDFIEDDVILLGDFDYMGYNLPYGINVESSKESSFRSALIDYRAVAVADTKPLVKDAFVKIDLSSE